MAEGYEPKYLTPSEIDGKANLIVKTGGSSRKFTITFPALGFALLFGRFAWDNTKLSMSIIYYLQEGSAYLKNYGDENMSITCSGNVVTVNCPGDWATVVIVSNVNIS